MVRRIYRFLGSEDVARIALNDERLLLERLDVKRKLERIVSSPRGCAAFATNFYFVRYNFYKLNFIIGSRSSPDENYWSGLVHNLYEELGGVHGKSHNELYREFLREVGVSSELDLTEPAFAVTFNRNWEDHCITAPFIEALTAIAIYELLDQPDYKLLLDVMQGAGISQNGLRFFQVHACAQHFELFEETVVRLLTNEDQQIAISRACSFVNSSQKQMWSGLLAQLENRVPIFS